MTEKYRVYYIHSDGRQEHLDGECYGDIRHSDENDALIERGFYFFRGSWLYPASERTARAAAGFAASPVVRVVEACKGCGVPLTDVEAHEFC